MTKFCGPLDLQVAGIQTPAGAVADDWHNPSGHIEDVSRTLTWSIHDVDDSTVAVQGEQYADGRVQRSILMLPEGRDSDLTSDQARQIAAALVAAADVLDGLQ